MILNNHHMATFFFMFSMIFFFMFVLNRYTWNIIMFFFCIILSVSFKTWGVIRDLDEKLEIMVVSKK